MNSYPPLIDELPPETAPATTLEKRRHARKTFYTPAVVTVGRWPKRRTFKTRLENISATGLRVQVDGVAVAEQAPVKVRWRVPVAWSGARRAKTYTLEGSWRSGGGIRLKGLLREQTERQEAWLYKSVVACAAAGLAVVIAALKARNVISFWYEPVFQVYSLAAASYVLSRVGISMFYREPVDNGILPSITVIVAAMNEEGHIEKTVRHCLESNYPKDRMEVMVVDDGSTDDTWGVLTGLESKYPSMRCYKFDKNRGKRHAMALGARKATGEVLVFLDSDSLLEPEALYRIVQPFNDPKVGAVAGHTLVIIEPDNFISKMEAVRYYVSQRIMKAAESIYNAVTCCPGPLSAYRRQAMMDVLEAWEHQMFLGSPATFGDDRSLTNYILPKYRVLYHAGARCRTFVPNRWKVFFRQQVRWKKSWVRETTVAARFMFRKHPVAAISYYLGIIVTLFSPLIALRAMLVLPLTVGAFTFLPYLAGLILVYSFFGLVYQYHTGSARWHYGLAFALLYVFILSFQNYYAILTVRRNHWGTR